MIREAQPSDASAIWDIIGPVIRTGETYTIDRDISRESALAYWMDGGGHCFVAEEAGEVLGTYYLKRNQAGGGSHVANCGYMVGEAARGKGIARAMCEHSMQMARELGFAAMQFNFVVSTNMGAVRLWESLGFETVGRLPDAFDHPKAGYVDALVMHRKL
ncbi:N-acetyltransferase [uncultured Erythrobacter sp.]|uniref:GNAT family N-acetyltransferase n=1 Tax=uncultured Erythrobacter sp. TaxID=263913 RepID=UPI0026367334|nr:N-acetyltransferase [uncultured Erythrobacter sp.]